MLMFRTQYDRVRVASEVGTSTVPEYVLSISDEGVRELKEVGVKDIYAEIQSHAASVDIHNVLARYARGDIDALNQRVGMFLDVTQFPKTYAEMYQRILEGEQMFDSLPIDVRREFNFNPVEFFSSIGTEKFSAFMEKYGNDEPDPVPDPVSAPDSPQE